MPGPASNVPEVRRGEPLSAEKFNAVAGAARRQHAGPGSFQSGAYTVQRRMGAIAASTPAGDGSEWFGYMVTELDAATSLAIADAGWGTFQPVDDDGVDFPDTYEIWNRHFNRVAVGVTVYVNSATLEFKRAGCASVP